MADTQTHEYRTIQNNFSLIVDTLADTVNPTAFAVKLWERRLVNRDIINQADIEVKTKPERIRPVITAVLAQIKLTASLYSTFIEVLEEVNPTLAEILKG